MFTRGLFNLNNTLKIRKTACHIDPLTGMYTLEKSRQDDSNRGSFSQLANF